MGRPLRTHIAGEDNDEYDDAEHHDGQGRDLDDSEPHDAYGCAAS